MGQSHSDFIGTWHLDSNGFPIVLIIEEDQAGNLIGRVVNENGQVEPVDYISNGSNPGDYGFRRVGVGFWQWYDLRVASGVCSGRFSHDTQYSVVSPLQEFVYHVRGWNADVIDRDIVP